jgi:hypothetical protein
MMADGSLLRSEGETWGPVSPDNVHERGVSRGGQPGSLRGAFIPIRSMTSRFLRAVRPAPDPKN